MRVLAALALALCAGACRTTAESEPAEPATPAAPAAPWIPLFDGETLGGWEPSPFGGEGEVTVEEGRVRIEFGAPLSGITWRGEFPSEEYELELVATRLSGTDFFCAVTFPVGSEHATFVLGGWGGAVVGLSCVDGLDGSENETTLYRAFGRGRAFRVRVRVSAQRVQGFVDDELLVDVERAGRRFSLRPEVLPSVPLGLATFATAATFEGMRYRSLAD